MRETYLNAQSGSVELVYDNDPPELTYIADTVKEWYKGYNLFQNNVTINIDRNSKLIIVGDDDVRAT